MEFDTKDADRRAVAGVFAIEFDENGWMCQVLSLPQHRAPVFGCVKFSWIITQNSLKLVPWHWHWNLKIREQIRLCWGFFPPSLKYLPTCSAHPQQENLIFCLSLIILMSWCCQSLSLGESQHTFIAQQASVLKRQTGYKAQELNRFYPTWKAPQNNSHFTFLRRWPLFSMTIVHSLVPGTKLSPPLQPSCSNLPPVPTKRYTGVVGELFPELIQPAPETFASL